MISLKKTYRHHIYSIIGTLAFHVILVGLFLISELNLKSKIGENVLFIEIPLEIANPERLTEAIDKLSGNTPGEGSERTNQPSGNFSGNQKNLLQDSYFDENYQKEIREAKKLISEVNSQLAKDRISMDDITMPVDITDGKSRDEISNTVYSGESNVVYHLENRYHLRLPIPVYLAKGGGLVVVDISVNREGKVISAKPRRSASILDEWIYTYAQIAAERTVFNPDQSAPAVQNGNISYTFIPQ